MKSYKFKKRFKLANKTSRRRFSKHAGFHPKNGGKVVMRGGIRF